MRIAMIGDEDRLHSQRLNGFERLRNRIIHLMARFGEPDSISRHGDYSVHGDYWGYPGIPTGKSQHPELEAPTSGYCKALASDCGGISRLGDRLYRRGSRPLLRLAGYGLYI